MNGKKSAPSIFTNTTAGRCTTAPLRCSSWRTESNGSSTRRSAPVPTLKMGRIIWMRLNIRGRFSQFQWSLDGEIYTDIGPCFDTSKLSDEYSEYGEFTGTFVGITCGDRMMHQHTADVDFFDYQGKESEDVK